MRPKVSVIIPIYNSEKYLKQCLDSVLNQSLHFFELILVDDGSSDKSVKICVEYAQRDSRVQIYQQKHQGPGHARNLGLKLAKGKYLSFLDSDDFFEPDMLKTLYLCAEKNDTEVIFYFYSNFDDITQKDIPVPPNPYLNQILHNSPLNPLAHKDILFQLSGGEAWKYFFKKELIQRHNLKFAETSCGEDAVFTMPARALAKRIAFLNKVFVHYRINRKDQLTKNPNTLVQLRKSYKLVEKILKSFRLWSKLKNSFRHRKKLGFEYVKKLKNSLKHKNKK